MADVDNKPDVVQVLDAQQANGGDAPQDETCQTTKIEENPELFSYTKTDYTTEIFKIEVRGLPKRSEYKDFLKFLKKNEINFNKIKLIKPEWRTEEFSHAYVSLRSEEERTKALELLPTLTFKGKTLQVQKAEALPDPLMLKRSRNNDERSNKRARNDNNNDKAKIDEKFDSLSEEEKNAMINDQVANFWRKPYEEQISIKVSKLAEVLNSVAQELKTVLKTLNQQQQEALDAVDFYSDIEKNRLVADFVIRSPQVNGYRNKCEFNVDANKNVGFRLGLYKEGTLRVVQPPESCPILSQQMFGILKHFSNFLTEKNDLSGYSPFSRDGHWKQMLVRTNQSNEALISLALHRQELTDDDINNKLVPSILEHFGNNIHGVSSIYIQVVQDRQGSAGTAVPKHIGGETHIYETLLNGSLKFRISPLSFFQINTPGAEILYSKIVELANCGPETTILDICCGTGTIGICMARSVKKVIGIEINKDAINDAKFNAELNDIKNIEFYCGSAEKTIRQVLNKIDTSCEDVVAIIDPPRCGLSSDFIKMIRGNKKIRKLVYVACEASSAKRNFIELCRPTSKTYSETPFTPKSAIPVDLFPHTDRCELVLFFERK